MKIDRATLIAYADGELDAVSAKRVEKAIADDPRIADEIERHLALRARLKVHVGGGAGRPRVAAGPPAPQPGKVVDLAAARQTVATPPRPRRWLTALGIVAVLLLGVAIGMMIRSGAGGDFRSDGGRLLAHGHLARALDLQLTETQAAEAPIKILVSFRDAGGAHCRAFQASDKGGIACREGTGWQIRELRAAPRAQEATYRRSGSERSALIASAQALTAGQPLDVDGERAALERGWR